MTDDKLTPRQQETRRALLIMDYWRRRGCRVQVEVETFEAPGKGWFHVIKTDMKNGLPAGFKRDAV